MLNNIVISLRKFFKISLHGKYIDPKSEDIFLVEYPKSGVTWLSFLIANLLSKETITFSNIYDYIPSLYNRTVKQLNNFNSPRIIKSHEPFSRKYKKVIYIIRDPRDVLVSYYYWHEKYVSEFNILFKDFAYKFIKSEVGGFGNYKDHVIGWKSDVKQDQKVLYVKYEDLKSDTKSALKEISDFIGIDATENELDQSVKNSSFEKMKSMEKEEKTVAKDFFAQSNNKHMFVRSGKGGEWEQLFDKDLKSEFKSHLGDLLIELGYEDDNNW